MKTTAAALAALCVLGAQAQSLPAPPTSPVPVTNYEYDPQGNPTKTTQAPASLNYSTTSTYDALGRRKDTTDAKSGVTQFGYDGQDRTVKVTDPRSLITQYPRNGLGDVNQLISPDTGTAGLTYDAAGNLKTRTDSRGVLGTYGYDALNRLTSVAYTQSGQTTQTFGWTYDQTGTGFSYGIGRLTSTSFPTGSSQYAYDALGRVTTDTQRVNAATGANASQISKAVGYTYDGAGHVTSITYPSGRVLTIAYTGGQPTSVSLGSTVLMDQIKWEPSGAVSSWNWNMASGPVTHSRSYDLSGRLVRYQIGGWTRDLTYDAADRIAGYTHYDTLSATPLPGLDQAFGYDELGRLTQITQYGTTWSIGYDANGNRTNVTNGGSVQTYSVSTTSNRLDSITNPARSFGYDSAGNTTSDGAGYTGTYDLSGRLATLTKATTATYSYDAQGRRVRKFDSSGSSSTTVFVYDLQGKLLGEYDSSGNTIKEYVWLGSTPIAIFTPDPANQANPPLAYYIHTDHLDTPRVIVDKYNNTMWRWIAEPFGTSAPETNPGGMGTFVMNLRFPGQYFDLESGLAANWMRSYDASTGRYNPSDPIGLDGGINTYAYVAGNPLGYVDPEGLAAAGAAIGGQIGGAIGGRFGGAAGRAGGRAIGAAVGSAIEDACRTPEHRGRIQAQGATYEDSESWNRTTPPTVAEGLAMLDLLVSRMPRTAYKARIHAIAAAREWIVRAGAAGGVSATVSKTFLEPGSRSDRIDIEVRTGRAFVP